MPLPPPGNLKPTVKFGEGSVNLLPGVYNTYVFALYQSFSTENFLNTNQVTMERFRIGDLELDTGTVTVLRGSKSIDLPKLSFDLLVCLAHHAPNVVNTDTLMDEIWGKTVVGEETVKQRVKLLRRSLDDSSIEPTYVGSVRGRGYRLIAPVERLSSPTEPGPLALHRHPWGLGVFITFVVLIGGILLTRLEWPVQQVVPPTVEQDAPIGRIAVLPFDNFSHKQEDEYLADGITEDITTALTKIDDLAVIARTSAMRYKDSGLRIVDIAKELGVGTVLEGSVQRFGSNLKITVQMIDAVSEEHYWAQSYDLSLSELPELQAGIAQRVAKSLQATVSQAGIEALQRSSTDVADAYDAYLKGRTYYRRWNPQDNETALAFYQQALVLDPDFALAHAGIANTYALRATVFGAGDEWAENPSCKQNWLYLSTRSYRRHISPTCKSC